DYYCHVYDNSTNVLF
nr:immunoglobulin light chain junction region [Macaca mulatta]MOV66525.1 immunoglobulin light chain junction region [Macaca mulatta]MOV68503.1 immunoglobulin light chain junction region [Macaca mulatta]